jgi:hypothetical protein
MFYDIRTLIQADTIVWLLSTCILLFVWKIRKTYPGFGYWVLMSAGITLGLQLQTLHGYAPPFVPILFGNGFFLASALSALIGIRVFLGRGGLARGFWFAAVAVESALVWFTFISPDLNMRVLLVSLFEGWVSIAIAIELFLNAPSEMRIASRLTGAVVGGCGLFLIFRGFATLLWLRLPSNYYPNALQEIGFFGSMAVSLLGAFGFIMMNTSRMEHEMEITDGRLKSTLRELEQKINQVKTLSGMLPICASCKKIRDDRGYWNSIEVYLQAHSEAEFSHGICPDCAKILFATAAGPAKGGRPS